MATTVYCKSIDLRLLPLTWISKMTAGSFKTSIASHNPPMEAKAAAPSVKITMSKNGAGTKTVIKWRVKGTPANHKWLYDMQQVRFVALYRDEHGQWKAVGSPLYPMTLEWTQEGGDYAVTAEGTDEHGHFFANVDWV